MLLVNAALWLGKRWCRSLVTIRHRAGAYYTMLVKCDNLRITASADLLQIDSEPNGKDSDNVLIGGVARIDDRLGAE